MQKRGKLSSKILNKKLEKLEREKTDWEQSSGSRIVFKYVSDNFIELISWGVIAIFVYMWWKAQGMPLDCSRITPEFCNGCFLQVSEGIKNLTTVKILP